MSGEAVSARAARPVRDGRLRFGDGWQFDCNTLRLKNPAGDDVELTMHERALLRAFLAAPQRTLSRDHLAQATGTHGTNVTQCRNADLSTASKAAWNHPDQTRRGVCVRSSDRERLVVKCCEHPGALENVAPVFAPNGCCRATLDRLTRIELSTL